MGILDEDDYGEDVMMEEDDKMEDEREKGSMTQSPSTSRRNQLEDMRGKRKAVMNKHRRQEIERILVGIGFVYRQGEVPWRGGQP